MDGEAEECRGALEREREAGRVRYSLEARRAARVYAQRRRAEGFATTVVAAELGISVVTLTRWLSKEAIEGSSRFIPVEVVASPTGSVVVHGPGGIRIEGADAGFVAKLFQALS